MSAKLSCLDSPLLSHMVGKLPSPYGAFINYRRISVQFFDALTHATFPIIRGDKGASDDSIVSVAEQAALIDRICSRKRQHQNHENRSTD